MSVVFTYVFYIMISGNSYQMIEISKIYVWYESRDTCTLKIIYLRPWALLAGWLISCFQTKLAQEHLWHGQQKWFPYKQLTGNVRLCGCPLIEYLCTDQNECLMPLSLSLSTLTLGFLHLSAEGFTHYVMTAHSWLWDEPLTLKCTPTSEKKNWVGKMCFSASMA